MTEEHTLDRSVSKPNGVPVAIVTVTAWSDAGEEIVETIEETIEEVEVE